MKVGWRQKAVFSILCLLALLWVFKSSIIAAGGAVVWLYVSLERLLKSAGRGGPVIIFFAVMLSAFPLPGYSWLLILAGFCYGMPIVLVTSVAAVVGAQLVFLATRWLYATTPPEEDDGEDGVHISEAELAAVTGVAAVVAGLNGALSNPRSSFRTMAALRLAPLPFGVLNVSLGLTDVDARLFLLINTVVCPVKQLVDIYIGATSSNFMLALNGSKSAEASSSRPHSLLLLLLPVTFLLLSCCLVGSVAQRHIAMEMDLSKEKKSRANEESPLILQVEEIA